MILSEENGITILGGYFIFTLYASINNIITGKMYLCFNEKQLAKILQAVYWFYSNYFRCSRRCFFVHFSTSLYNPFTQLYREDQLKQQTVLQESEKEIFIDVTYNMSKKLSRTENLYRYEYSVTHIYMATYEFQTKPDRIWRLSYSPSLSFSQSFRFPFVFFSLSGLVI